MWTLVGSQPPTFLGLVGRSDIRSQKTCGLWWSVIHYVGFVDRSGANRVTGRIDSFVFSFFFFSKWTVKVLFIYCAGETNFTVQRQILLFIYCLYTVYRTHNHFIQKKILKIGPTVLFTHLKIILLQYFSVFSFSFQFSVSVFSFQLYPNGP